MEAVRIPFDKRKLFWWTIFCTSLVIILLVGLAYLPWRIFDLFPIFPVFVWGISCLYFVLDRWAKKTVALVMDEEGLVDHSSMLSVGRIDWDEIEYVYPIIYGIIVVKVKDPGYLLRRVKNPLKKLALYINWKMSTGVVHLNPLLIPISSAELIQKLEHYLDKSVSKDDFSAHLID